MTKKRAATADFTYTKLLKRLAPGALAIAACLLLLLLAGLTNQHEWAVGWLRRRYEGLDPLPFMLWMGLERGGILIALGIVEIAAPLIRRRKPKNAEENGSALEKAAWLKRLGRGVEDRVLNALSFISVAAFAVQAGSVVLLKLLGAGVGTSAAAMVCVSGCCSYLRDAGGSRWMRTLQGAVGGVYIGYAFAHWGMSSWWTPLWTTAALYAAPFWMMPGVLILLLSARKIYGAFKMALKYWKWIVAAAGATALWLWVGGSLGVLAGMDGRLD